MRKPFTLFLSLVAVSSINAQIVINEVYAGGGNSKALYPNDFVELVNSGDQEETLSDAYLQYASATKTFNTAIALPKITLKPKQAYLIRLGKGKEGGSSDFMEDYNALQTFNIDPTSKSFGKSYDNSINLGGNGKLVLTTTKNQISSPNDEGVLDFVGWGTANQFEGEVAPAITDNDKSISRTKGVDSNNNKVDFKRGKPTPQNMEETKLSTNEISSKSNLFVKNTIVENHLTFSIDSIIKIYNLNGQLLKSEKITKNQILDISYLPKGIYIISGEINGKVEMQKIIKK